MNATLQTSWSVSLVLSSLILLAACSPRDERPGFWLSGELVETPVTDWSFTAEIQEIFVETRTWYGVPHSVTTACVARGGTLYVPSVYFEGGEFPDARFWNRNVVRDPRVRLKMGERLFEREAVHVEDPGEWSEVLDAFTRRSSWWKHLAEQPESERPKIIFFRMDPRDNAD